MKRIAWKWLLPIALLALALACHIYDVHEYRMGARRRPGNNDAADGRADSALEYSSQHSPALAGRLSQGVNFPSLVLAYPLKSKTNPLYERNSEFTLISISLADIGFFIAIIFFWFWVGIVLDGGQRAGSTDAWPRKGRLIGLGCGLLFGTLNAAYADQMIATQWLPAREIGAFGIAWACASIAYFTWRLAQDLTHRAMNRGLLALAIASGIVGILWIGGSWGATQALGEYFRPTRSSMMSLPGQCTENETPPENFMRRVESQAAMYNLSLQKVVVCRGAPGIPQNDSLFAGAVLGRRDLSHWLALRPHGCVYQFRRHFAVVTTDEEGDVLVEAALIQSRWDYLMQNWYRIHAGWFWPYEGVEDMSSPSSGHNDVREGNDRSEMISAK